MQREQISELRHQIENLTKAQAMGEAQGPTSSTQLPESSTNDIEATDADHTIPIPPPPPPIYGNVEAIATTET